MSPALRDIRTLDPVREHQRIVRLSMRQDFPFDSTRSLEVALFRTFASPRISGLLADTGEFARDAQGRYDETDFLVSELIEHGYESDRGAAALRKINQRHKGRGIANDEYLYVLSTFLFEPIRWNARFGWRRLTEIEREAYFRFWREVGRRMGIKDIPDDAASFEHVSRDYERKHFNYAETNARIGEYTRDMMAGWFPRMLRPLVRQGMYALMDDDLLKAFGFPRPWPGMRATVVGAMKLRAALLWMLPARRSPLLRTMRPRRGRSRPETDTPQKADDADRED